MPKSSEKQDVYENQLAWVQKTKRPKAFRFEPLNQTQYYYGKIWGLR